MAKIIKCSKCGTYNKNKDYCDNCGALISYKKKREQRIEEEKTIRFEKAKKKPPNFIEKLRAHQNLAYRILGWILYSGFAVVSAIGAFIAWLVFAIAAG
ncbi:hypothetical protein DFQ05_1744 [Winogradskyella wandonensis]|uniref:Zinc ribbon protein n=1 Tax=Winogradskyella wandonensis TaxID=1442586 RepID=A0A4R1KTU7_9FLAO|nr:hypothetical protein [Winogradskyella wandonensis]TCK67960.1 hypothetical protein DFQ05_1744 [Winogradskyella wandonensis]